MLWYGDTWGFSGLIQYGIVIDPCTTESGYWQNHVDYILTTNASLLFFEEPSAASIIWYEVFNIFFKFWRRHQAITWSNDDLSLVSLCGILLTIIASFQATIVYSKKN